MIIKGDMDMDVDGKNDSARSDMKRRSWLLPVAVPAVLLLTIIVALFINNSLTTRYEVEHAERVLRDSAAEQASTLDTFFEAQYQTLELVAANIAAKEENQSIESIRHSIVILAKNTSFQSVCYIKQDGTAYSHDGKRTNVSGRMYFAQAMDGTRAIEKIESSMLNGNPMFILAVPVLKDGRAAGLIMGSYTEEKLRELITPRAYGGEADSIICNSDGVFVINTNNSTLRLSKDNIFSSLSSSAKFSEGHSIEDVRKDISEGRGGTSAFVFGGRERYVTYMPLNIHPASGGQWYMFNILPGDVLEADTALPKWTSLVLFFFVMLVSSVTLLLIILRERQNARLVAADREQLRISEEQFRIAATQGERHVARYDIKSGVYYCADNGLFSRSFGKEVKNAPQCFIDAGIIDADSADDLINYFDNIRRGENGGVSFAVRSKDGEALWYRTEATIIFDAAGKPDQAILVFYDITEQREKEAAYKKWQQSLQERAPESYALYRCNVSKAAPFSVVNGSLLKIGFDKDIGAFNEQIRAYAGHCVFADDRDSFTRFLDSDALLAKYRGGVRSDSMEFRDIFAEEDIRWIRVTVELVQYLNSDDIEAFLMFEDIDESKKADLLTKELAESDPLTGVLNRTVFAARCEEALAEMKEGTQHALIMLDVDGFKLLNDTFGHSAGDQNLVDTANALRSILRRGDLLGRLGGDEFMIFLKDIPYDAVIEKKARQICALLRKSYSIEVQVSASIGIAVCPRDGGDYDTLYRNADSALYQAKEGGRDKFVFFSREMAGEYRAEDGGDTSSHGGQPLASAAKHRMLVVDDDKMTCQLLAALFKDKYTVDTVNDGRMALIRMRRYGVGISVVLLDLLMPGLDGFAILEKMRESAEMRTIPVVVVSSAGDPEVSLRAIQSGASDFVTKPIDPNIIRTRVESAVSKAENERLRAQNSYLQLQSGEEAKYRTVIESTGTIVIEYDWVNNVFFYDPSISRYIFGAYDGRRLWQIMLSDRVAASMDVKAMQEFVHELANDRERSGGTMLIQLKAASGDIHWFRLNVFKKEDEYKLTEKLILTFNDVNEEVLADNKLRFQAERDELTGLYNRRTFLAKAEEMMRSRPAGYYFMSVIDIDGFKTINDRFGHAEGDSMLRYMADRLQSIADNVSGLCGRLGGDVFVTLCPHNQSLLKISEYQPKALLAGYPLGLELTCSAGHYLVDDPDITMDNMLDRASLAKRSVKGSYSSKQAWYDERMREQVLFEQEIIDSMETALEAGEFELRLQPQYDQTSGRMIGAEALARWRHNGAVLPPDRFIPLFEKNGFITRLDEYVWEQTCALLRRWLDEGRVVVPVSVNLSRVDLYNPKLRGILNGLIEKYRLSITLLRLEITETACTQDSRQLTEVVDALRKDGFFIEMDDFGSGYSSFNMFKDIAVDMVKLDMKFLMTANNENSGRSGLILNSIVRLSRWLNIPVIAEGVETPRQADFLKTIGCSLAQGYLYARPMPVSEFEELLTLDRTANLRTRAIVTSHFNNEEFWNIDSQATVIFNSFVGAACIVEYREGRAEVLRANDKYYAEVGVPRAILAGLGNNIMEAVLSEDLPVLKRAISIAIAMKGEAESTCETRWAMSKTGAKHVWLGTRMRVIAQNHDCHVLYVTVENVTRRKELEEELEAAREELRQARRL